jgi:hypothetical protein
MGASMKKGDFIVNRISGDLFLIILIERFQPTDCGKYYLRNESTGRSGFFDIGEFEPLSSLHEELF